jgi:hypothetical protein
VTTNVNPTSSEFAECDVLNEWQPRAKPEATDLQHELPLSAESGHPAELDQTAQVDP